MPQVCARPLERESSREACWSGRCGVEMCCEGQSSGPCPVPLVTVSTCPKKEPLSPFSVWVGRGPDPRVVTAQEWVRHGDLALVGLTEAREDPAPAGLSEESRAAQAPSVLMAALPKPGRWCGETRGRTAVRDRASATPPASQRPRPQPLCCGVCHRPLGAFGPTPRFSFSRVQMAGLLLPQRPAGVRSSDQGSILCPSATRTHQPASAAAEGPLDIPPCVLELSRVGQSHRLIPAKTTSEARWRVRGRTSFRGSVVWANPCAPGSGFFVSTVIYSFTYPQLPEG